MACFLLLANLPSPDNERVMNTEWERNGRELDVLLTARYAGYVPPRGNNFHIVHRGEFVRALAVARVHRAGNDFVVKRFLFLSLS